jgi:hypothetical protein
LTACEAAITSWSPPDAFAVLDTIAPKKEPNSCAELETNAPSPAQLP